MENTTTPNNQLRITLGHYATMIISMYFNDIKDFINLEIGVKRYRGNMERFHFNPISLNKYSRKLFPNIETFHIYNKDDEIFKDGRIFKKVIWYKVDYSTYLKKKEKWSVYKNIEYTKGDIWKYGNTIPLEVTSIIYGCFEGDEELTSITIPTTVKEIGSSCFSKCSSLTSVSIPSTIREIEFRCFKECTTLPSIIIPPSVSEMGNYCFGYCTRLSSIDLSSSVNKIGNYCFIECSSLPSINLPSSVCKIGDYCFYKCTSLTNITIPSTITSFGRSCFFKCGCEEMLKKNERIPKECFYE
ncbi:hypothetical protein EDI_329100 [Entamoeba dispar SAW760]|uniref:Leucine rich repeat containing protein BspA family protein n=1 Tax=Entamoeba dispar (strain ATCC PRA-260 / SAW760) TaxID=370354 RepID=B0EKD9_ENTDS|nr:uncharacterized protein EDI_329100 [Entamoeba dispar SAW760]EDR25009.1 hypothetical protein EDI_329100 [Entamoeba dispar SAW760]|eukprot:EDR25009.1 hypothetical protein EDI_329100 [Entamoeba dispar SAW760]